ncbi:MAG: MogA/MoaB family molybdenum cofactor biosynthesis protein [Planctomycetota bacterium]|jgi:molybdenum cofactor synthesis domain-containing protein
MPDPFRFAVLTVSDRGFRGETEDTSGPAVIELTRRLLGAELVEQAVAPDEEDHIADHLVRWSLVDPAIDLILTTGGTGLGPRDITPEAIGRVIEREHPGLIQLMQMRCYEKTPKTFLSRGVAGTVKRSLVIALPGSKKGAVESLEAVCDILPHALGVMRGEIGDHGPGVR